MASGDAPRKLNGALRVWLVAVSAPLLRSEERGPGAGRDSELVVDVVMRAPSWRCATAFLPLTGAQFGAPDGLSHAAGRA
jgi:hypothetical protein